MTLSRRSILKSAGALPVLAGSFGFQALGFQALGFQALAQTGPEGLPYTRPR